MAEAVILAAGKGSRLKSGGTNKAMELIGDKPLICFAIDALIYAGINVIWIVKYYQDCFDKLDLIYQDKKVELRYINEYEHMGSLHSFALIQGYVNDRFILLDCDLIIDEADFVTMLQRGFERMADENLCGVMALVCKADRDDTNMLLVEDQKVKRFIKEGRSDCVRGGYIFIWTPDVFCDVSLFLNQKIYSLSQYYDYLAQKVDIGVMELENVWDVDTYEDVIYTLKWLQKKTEGQENE